MGNLLWVSDVATSLFFPLAFWCAWRRGWLSRPAWALYWAGCALGLSWELGFHWARGALFVLHVTLPFPGYVLGMLHALWDGALFMAGYGLVKIVCPRPHFRRFAWREQGVLLGWGVGSELAVDLSMSGRLWTYLPGSWNPRLFDFHGVPITLLPQLVWLVAPFVFYRLSLLAQKKYISDGHVSDSRP